MINALPTPQQPGCGRCRGWAWEQDPRPAQAEGTFPGTPCLGHACSRACRSLSGSFGAGGEGPARRDAHGEICEGECHAEHAGVFPDPSVARLQVPEPALHDEDVNGNLEATSQGKATFQPGQCASTIQVNAASPSRAARIRSVRTCGDGSGGSQDGGQPDRRDGYAQGDGRAPQLPGDGTQMRDGPAYGREALEGRRRDGGRALCKAQRLRQIPG